LALARDATSLGDRFTVLSLSVVYRGGAIPVAWKVWPANVKHAWKPEWGALLASFSARVPPGWTVIVMTDRGLYARWLFEGIQALGWHPLMRITRLSKFRKAGSRSNLPVTALVPKMGRRWQGRGVAFPNKPNRRLPWTLLACWDPGHEEPGFLVTDLGPEQTDGLWYGMRAWLENGFKLRKRGGGQWPATRMTDPARVERLWLVLAAATCYVLAVGGEAAENDLAVETVSERPPTTAPSRATERPESPARRTRRLSGGTTGKGPVTPSPQRRASGTRHRLVSIFRQGLAALISLLIAGHPGPEPQWKPEPWLEFRGEIKPARGQPPFPIPKNPSL
jgi:hypothetical protein